MRGEAHTLALALAAVVVLVGGVGGAVAQDAQSGAQTAQETAENATPDAGGGDGTNTTQIQDKLGQLEIHSYSFSESSSQMVISATWRGSFPTRATFTELIELDSAGSTDISFKRVRLRPGERTEITVGAEKRGGTAAVLVTTPESVENSSALVLQSGSPDGQRDPVPFSLAALLIAGSGVGGAGAVFVFVRDSRNNDTDDWHERIS